ncbi:acyltransferase [Clostridium beijerinckii]|uniref:Inner membrane protein YiaH n=1 Tax=Clostridium beijerinckii TaxID=1520 RepID=A0A1S8S3D3_CLOBE|nr:acyltransferase family protein [Clostridium beijerinckii]NRY60836.1 surface polysaccharide O-acyltransferase-like enzyme [Clostridium beijerinckii]OOM59937.1 inner membrane protein YiaH [Clostridium beijerinckii]
MDKKRKIYYDVIRVLACIFVIGIHSTDPALTQSTKYSLQWFSLIIFQIIVRTAVPLFIMLSGALIINGKEESLKKFYFKRFSSTIMPFFVYSLFYICVFKYKADIFNLKTFGTALIEMIRGPVFYHLWFVYTIVGIYIFAPFVKIMLKNLSEEMLLNLIIIIVFISIIFTYMPLLGISIGVDSIIFIGYIDYFVVGYFLTKNIARLHYNKIIIFGAISFILSLLISVKFDNYQDIIYGSSPTMILISSAFFMYFIKNKDKIVNNEKSILYKIITFTSQYTFSIYMIHVYVLQKIIYPSGMNSMYINIGIGTIATMTLTLLISLIIVIIVDNLVIKQISKLINILSLKVI